MAGQDYSVQCTIIRSGTLSSATLEATWLDNTNTIITSGTGYAISGSSSTTTTTLTSTLTIHTIRTSQAGIFTCEGNMTIPGIVDDHQVNASTPVRVTSECRVLVLSVCDVMIACISVQLPQLLQ